MNTTNQAGNPSSGSPLSAETFLQTLFPSLGGEFIELRAVGGNRTGGAPQRYYSTIEDFVRDLPYAFSLAQAKNVYVGVCPRRKESGKKEDVTRAFFIWADLDAHDYKGGREEARQRLSSFPLPPTMVVCSGNGYHAYWQLKQPFPIDGPIAIDLFESYLETVSKYLNADIRSCTLERILRLPDTLNHKDPSNPLPVTLVEYQPGNVYDLLNLINSSRSDNSDHGQIKKETHEQVKGADQIEDFFQKNLSEFHKSGQNATALCPFHPDSNPSFSVQLTKGIWHCFGCGKSGNLEQFAQAKGISTDEIPQIDGEGHGGGRASVATQLTELALSKDIELFHDQFHRAYARIKINGHHEIWPLESGDFKGWLSNIYWVAFHKSLPSEAIASATNTLSSKARFDNPSYKLQNRVAWHDDAIYFDLADDEWRCVRVDSKGWKIVVNPPILFRRFSHQMAQVEPTNGGNMANVLQFVNLEDQKGQLLFLVSLISGLVPDIAHPIDVPHGEQGAAKSTLCALKRRLIDPSIQVLQTLPRKEADFAQLLNHHYYPNFDNVSHLSNEQSDMLCRAVTGGAFEKRKLYTDEDNIFFQFKQPMGLNSINLVIQKADLLDRSLLFKLNRIPKEKRQDEKSFWEKFDQAKPAILGAMLDVLSQAMTILPKVQTAELFRMADFTRWGCAVALALGYQQEDFINAYRANVGSQNDEAIQASPVALAILELLKNMGQWNGGPTALLKELDKIAPILRIDIKDKDWPKAPNSLMRKINVIKTNLREKGLVIEQADGGDRQLTIRNESSSETSQQDSKQEDINKSTPPSMPTHAAETQGPAVAPTVLPNNAEDKFPF